ncbi:MAG: hypothetical protein Q9207_003750 [Kuettlingeria erythrocarpa]
MTGGTAISHPTFSPSIDAVLESRGNDYIRNDPDGKHMRLDAHTVLKLSLFSSLLQFRRTHRLGHVRTITADDDHQGTRIWEARCTSITRVLSTLHRSWRPFSREERMQRAPSLGIPVSLVMFVGSATAGPIVLVRREAGQILTPGEPVVHFTFETGDEKLKALENGMFVGAGRFVLEKERPVTVEYRVSKVIMQIVPLSYYMGPSSSLRATIDACGD